MTPQAILDELVMLDPMVPRDQDRILEISAGLQGIDRDAYFAEVVEFVRKYGGRKEPAYEAILTRVPDLPEQLYALRIELALLAKAERALEGCN